MAEKQLQSQRFFIHAESFAAPFVSDASEHYIEAETPKEALEKLAEEYDHSCGLYSAACYESAEVYFNKEEPLAKWLCNFELAKRSATKELDRDIFLGYSPDLFEIDEEPFAVLNPREGRVI